MSEPTLTQTNTKRAAAIEATALHFLTVVYPDARAPMVLGKRRLVIGREPGVGELQLEDRRASRQHLEIRFPRPTDAVPRVKDLGSKNGSWLNGASLRTETGLNPGDVIRVGDTLMVYSRVAGAVLDIAEGRSIEAQVMEARVARLGATELPVLVHGPSGAGKERVAQALHAASGRRGRLVSINCSTFTDNLLASELFGHVSGAFSGANTRRDGLFASAAGGTLFLDEIAEMPLGQQPALLRALQEGKVRPVGSDREVDVDVRVVAATHQDLEAAVEAGSFRGDLYARLAGAQIEVPPLALRRGDILPLFALFYDAAHELGAETAEALLLHDWPYNIRQLQHAAQAIKAEASGARIDLGQLPVEIRESFREKVTTPGEITLDENVLRAALQEHSGHVSEVAKALGRTRQQVYRRLKLYGLDAADFRDES